MILERLRSKPTSRLTENQSKENEICPGAKCVSGSITICSGKFKWLLLTLNYQRVNSFSGAGFELM